MRYEILERKQIKNRKPWFSMTADDGTVMIFNSKAEARNYLHDKGYTINSPDILLVEVR